MSGNDRESKLADLTSQLICLVEELMWKLGGGETFECVFYELMDIKRRAQELGVR